MSTSPIPAAATVPAPFASPAGSGRSASADHSDFHQVLQQVHSPAASSPGTGADPGADASPAGSAPVSQGAAHNATPSAATSSATASSASAGSGSTGFLASLTASSQQPGCAESSSGVQAKKEKSAGKSLSTNSKQGAKEAGSAQLSKQGSESAKSVTDPSLLPIAALPTPAESSLSPTLPADSDCDAESSLTACQPASPDGASFSLPGGSADPAALASASAHGAATSGEFAAAAGDARPAVDAAISATAPAVLPEPAIRAPFSATTGSNSVSATAAAKPKAKVQGALSSGKADDSASPASVAGEDAAAETKSSRHVLNTHAAAAQESIAERNSAPGAAANSASSQGATRSGRTRPVSQGSSAQDTQHKSSDVSTASALDPGASLESTVSSHGVGFKAELAALTPDRPASGAPPAASLTAPLAAQPASASAAQPSAAASAQSQGPANTAPDPPPTVDSGQLRATANQSELKVSVQLPELGKVEVRAVTAHDVTTAHVTAFRHDGLAALAAERTGLEQVLRSRDVTLGSLDSHARDPHAQNSHAQQQSGEQQRQQSPAQFLGGDSSVATAETTFTGTGSETSAAGVAPDRSRLSVHV